MQTGSRLIDVSHAVEHGMVTYKGLPAPVVCDFLSRQESRKVYAEGVEFHIGKVEMVANTGTYLDSPFHRYADGTDLAGLPPIYIQTGADETLLDDSRKLEELARKSGVDVTLEVVPEMQHVFQFLAGTAPEADAAIRRLGDWVRPKLGLG